ncbi:alpha-mannosidase [Tengunoibacter tsumagoiensis]|uniref:alpha-mannosidase n=1 Tax=Tengunoibacter tsumagoiensis TaxID=2014871 RepID=A0A402A6X4_9CHLR|nr:alpha-mannosidase [Tengunoibacter tsumagoiensis]GCE14882.1 alpha-mannosidase [Tengunoibacter tsumagoiensis]
MSHKIRWTVEKISQRLSLIEHLVYRRRHALPPFRFLALSSPLETPPVGIEVDDSAWTVIKPDEYWGEWRQNFVLRSTLEIPQEWGNELPLALSLPIGDAGNFSHPEALAYIDGVSYAACDRHHHEFALRSDWQDGKTHTLALHGWTAADGPQGARLLMKPCEVVQIDQPTRDFIATARVALGTVKVIDESVPARGRLLTALDRAFTLLDTHEPLGETFYASVAAAHEALQAGIAQAGAPLDVEVLGTGHAHIDVAWLWTLGQTRRKASRTFHTVDRLMEQFPDYHFTQSQPQLYDYIRQDHPDLFEAIKRRIAEGRWEPIGGMWVEADCNLSGPESLARQFLLGRAFFAEHFGEHVDTPVLWLPDVFGYAWALPQLIKQAGLDYFFTIKIGWSQYNRLPYDSFWWQGLDGTRVLTHFSTTKEHGSPWASTYNGQATPNEIMGTWTNFQQKDLAHDNVTPPLLTAFGYGDGGGGPTREMLENLREMKAFPALPQTRQTDVGTFFKQLEESSGEQLPTWNGELYLELHRGTYTTQSRNKRWNRKSEFLLHDAEFLAAQASLLSTSYRYPAQEITRAWQLICLNQFHDIIPGSSIHDVYVESEQQYQTITELGTGVRNTALQTIADHVAGDILLANPISFERIDLAFWPRQLPAGQHLQSIQTGEPVSVQTGAQGTWIDAGALEPFSITGLQIVKGAQPQAETGLIATEELLENALIRIELNRAGDITRIYDKVREREVLPAGAIANQFQAFEDRPMDWDAWDVDIFYDDKQWLAEPASSIRLVDAGPLRATIEVKRQILHSQYTQLISLNYNSPQLDIETNIDWRERHILLKVAFPVDILSPVATYEIQWGNVQRPTHRNTSWDWARFETCGQKFVDLSEGDYGVSILNDCKYGHDIQENVIRISLLRSPTSPDPEADQGQHRFTYSLLPHAGNLNEVTIQAAYALNDPLLTYTPERQTGKSSVQTLPALVSVDKPNIVIETIKQAEDGNGIIVRLYESQRHRGKVTVSAGFELAEAWHTNLLEKEGELLPVQGKQVTLSLKPYEIVTLRLVKA